jgi:hypothetical protein
MSLSRLALRIAAVKALRGKTFAGNMVRDSEIGPIDESVEGAEIPFIVVYTDETDAGDESPNEQKSLFATCNEVSLTIEMAVTTRMKPGNESDWAIPTTDAGLELTIDALERQIRLALSDPDNEWAEIWRRLVREIKAQKSSRGASATKGVRFAARQIVLTVDVAREPIPGEPLSGLWSQFMGLVAADADLAKQKDLIASLATGGSTDWAEFKKARAVFGLDRATGAALKIGPLSSIDPDTPPFASNAKTTIDDSAQTPIDYVPLGQQ